VSKAEQAGKGQDTAHGERSRTAEARRAGCLWLIKMRTCRRASSRSHSRSRAAAAFRSRSASACSSASLHGCKRDGTMHCACSLRSAMAAGGFAVPG
jgi:hypothetical protein